MGKGGIPIPFPSNMLVLKLPFTVEFRRRFTPPMLDIISKLEYGDRNGGRGKNALGRLSDVLFNIGVEIIRHMIWLPF